MHVQILVAMLGSAVALVSFLPEASGKRAGPIVLPTLTRAVAADAVVVGKVTSIEKDPIEASPFPGADKVPYTVAVVEIETPLAGIKNLTHVKVGFPANAEGNAGGGRPGRGGGGFGPIALTDGQKGCFFLVKHPGGFYTLPPGYLPLDAGTDGFQGEIDSVKKALAVVSDPMKALKAAKAEDRLAAASVLIAKYRTPPQGGGEVENRKVPHDESVLIVKALVEADWAASDPNTGVGPLSLASQLALGPNEGFKPAPFKGGGNYADYFKAEFAKWAEKIPADFSIRHMVRKEK